MEVNPVLETGEMGVTMPVGCEWFPPETKFRMLRDRIMVKVLDWQPSRWIKVESFMKPLRGQVISVGPGANQKRRYLNDKREPYKVGETGRRIPCDVKVGDIVELGGLELRGYGFIQIMLGNTLHVCCQEADVGFVDDEPLEANGALSVFQPTPRVKTSALVAHDRTRERKRGVELTQRNFSRGTLPK